MHECQLVHTVGTPLAELHSLIPTYAYYGVETECRVTEIVLHVGFVVRQFIAPNERVRKYSFHQLRCGIAEHHLCPMQVLTPVEVRDFVLIHVERANGNRPA